VRGCRDGENPARRRGHLDKLLPARGKVRKVEHHAALPYAELPDFMATLRTQEGVAARALELAILAAARTGEAIGARWSEIDIGAKLWTIPANEGREGAPGAAWRQGRRCHTRGNGSARLSGVSSPWTTSE
jgi:integrase